MQEIGKYLVIAGASLALLGLLLWSGFGRSWLGRLPGDVRIEREGFSFFFPVATCILLSIILSVVLWLFRR